MQKSENITGTEALARMRRLKGIKNASFVLLHLTADLSRGETHGMRKVERCRVRKGMPENGAFSVNPDHYLAYEDLDTAEPRFCFKKLIRYVGFPPDYRLLKVNWFN